MLLKFIENIINRYNICFTHLPIARIYPSLQHKCTVDNDDINIGNSRPSDFSIST